MDDVIESTLWIGGCCSCLQVPPVSSERVLSGDWRTDATIAANQRIRVTSVGDTARVYIESRETGELFAMCPIAPGKKDACILAAIDSSRNFVVRVEDAESGRHAFIGLSFTDRGDAFDFNVALSDHQRQVLAAGSSGSQKPNDVPELTRDLSLQEGQTIRVAFKGQKPRGLSGSGAAAASPSGGSLAAVPFIPAPPGGAGGSQPRAPGLPQTSSALRALGGSQTSKAVSADPFGALALSNPPFGGRLAPAVGPAADAASAAPPKAPTDRQGWTLF